ncbi:MAG TPA: CDP-alcohol phosphatidyltransferase family protein [Thermoanaerobaculia bacterium]|jgi:cardiolipin synthase|nr:CDP-alcohol phosphatidyltransferase family protein [Thermoanaerobaculia bacterium]
MRHIPNILTGLRLLLVPCFLGASMRGLYAVAFVIFVTAAVTDILDGWLARRWNVRSKFGALFDPAADKTLMVCGFLYYTLAHDLPRGGIPGWLTFTVFIRDFLIAVFAYLMYTRINITRFPPTILGKASTVLQAVTLACVIAVNAFTPRLEPLAEMLFRASLVMTLVSGWGYMRRASRILEQDVLTNA